MKPQTAHSQGATIHSFPPQSSSTQRRNQAPVLLVPLSPLGSTDHWVKPSAARGRQAGRDLSGGTSPVGPTHPQATPLEWLSPCNSQCSALGHQTCSLSDQTSLQNAWSSPPDPTATSHAHTGVSLPFSCYLYFSLPFIPPLVRV